MVSAAAILFLKLSPLYNFFDFFFINFLGFRNTSFELDHCSAWKRTGGKYIPFLSIFERKIELVAANI